MPFAKSEDVDVWPSIWRSCFHILQQSRLAPRDMEARLPPEEKHGSDQSDEDPPSVASSVSSSSLSTAMDRLKEDGDEKKQSSRDSKQGAPTSFVLDGQMYIKWRSSCQPASSPSNSMVTATDAQLRDDIFTALHHIADRCW